MSVECNQVREKLENENGTETVHYRLEPGESLSEAVVEAVAAASGRSIFATDEDAEPLPPLYDVIDPDALNSLFKPGRESEQIDGCVSFTYCNHRVVVESSGSVLVSPAE
ncbi:HalOD1 output domain-containing protein [Natribaculum luteum]|uniref:HalOD1 output domain-containing protein n=1 Tax=Natribaculum luteum TaxID=1586232 RepID=A0ABD5NUD8_9EURY|nr:HalOD1 output domain-containing protein [Natribaculum luteum]